MQCGSQHSCQVTHNWLPLQFQGIGLSIPGLCRCRSIQRNICAQMHTHPHTSNFKVSFKDSHFPKGKEELSECIERKSIGAEASGQQKGKHSRHLHVTYHCREIASTELWGKILWVRSFGKALQDTEACHLLCLLSACKLGLIRTFRKGLAGPWLALK